MEGFQIKDMNTGQIVMTPAGNDLFLWVFVIIGLLGIGIFILARLKTLTSVPQNLHYVLLGFGLVFSSGGFLFMLSDGPERIIFDRSQSSMIIEEQNGDDARETRIPFGELSGFIVQPKYGLLLSQSSFENNNKSAETGLYLLRNNGGFFLLSGSADRSSIIRDAESLSSFTGMPFSTTDTARFFQGIQNRNDTILQKQESAFSRSGPGMTMKWNEYGSSWKLIFLGLVIIGFNVIVFKAPFPSKFRRIIMALLILAVDTVMLSIFLFNLFGHHMLEVNESVISYRHLVGSYELSLQEIKTGEVAMVSSGISSDEPGLLIVSRRGIQVLSSLMTKYGQERGPGLSDAVSVFSMFSALSREIIQIESRSLSFRTRYETDQVIRNYLR